jgi:DNA-directed RNA polymerase specialized sigma24 family protein
MVKINLPDLLERFKIYADHRTGSAHGAQDIAQIAFEKLVRAIPAGICPDAIRFIDLP